jgi:hypothetical protein
LQEQCELFANAEKEFNAASDEFDQMRAVLGRRKPSFFSKVFNSDEKSENSLKMLAFNIPLQKQKIASINSLIDQVIKEQIAKKEVPLEESLTADQNLPLEESKEPQSSIMTHFMEESAKNNAFNEVKNPYHESAGNVRTEPIVPPTAIKPIVYDPADFT